MAKRKLSRQQLRRIRAAQSERRRRAADPSESDALLSGQDRPGLVTANFGHTLIVETDSRELVRCTPRRNLGPAVCGDRALWRPSGSDAGVVTAIEPRRSLLCKTDYGGRLKPVAANLDQAALVIAPRPPPSESLLDRYLVVLETLRLDALLVLNKIDLPAADELSALRERLVPFQRIGYPLLAVSSRTGRGLDALGERLRGRANVLLGQSGVGKSSLTNALVPDLDVRVQALSAATGHGTHTTTTAMLYPLPGGGHLIDSPGVRSFEPDAASLDELERGFIEFRPFLGQCRFGDCGHDQEPGCALREAAAAGVIEPRRLASFLQIRQNQQHR